MWPCWPGRSTTPVCCVTWWTDWVRRRESGCSPAWDWPGPKRRKPKTRERNSDMVRDPVCGMTIQEAEAAATSRYDGQTIYFCAIGCKEKFDAAPERYLNGGGVSPPDPVQVSRATARETAPPHVATAKIDIGIRGMHCASCVSTIEKALAAVPGVTQAVVNLAAERGTIRYDPKAATPAAMVKAIAQTGYTPLVEKATIPIGGISCASCVATIEGALRETPGVLSASVNLSTNAATVEFAPGAASLQDLRRAIRDVGYEPLEVAEGTQGVPATADHEKAAREREIRRLKTRLIVGAALTVPVFLGSFPEWFPWVPGPLTNFWTLLLLTTPVQFWVGAQFYRGFWAALRHKTSDMNTLIAVGTSAAYLYSAAMTLSPEFFRSRGIVPAVYFDTAAVIITLILVGRLLEAVAKGRTSEAIKRLMGLQARTARVDLGGREADIPVEEVRIGDLVVVRPGEKVPVDGVVREGASAVDE